ncbi:hypothetical protein J6590_030354 [Homalodisca vitripennis]|nr:hypothetical protein J6590_030354 [Homalodisca vitripennis]
MSNIPQRMLSLNVSRNKTQGHIGTSRSKALLCSELMRKYTTTHQAKGVDRSKEKNVRFSVE